LFKCINKTKKYCKVSFNVSWPIALTNLSLVQPYCKVSPRSVSYQIGNYLIFNRASICQNGKSWNKTQDQDKATILSLFTTKRIKRAAGYVLPESAWGAIRCLPSAHKLLTIQKMLSTKPRHASAHSHDRTLNKMLLMESGWWCLMHSDDVSHSGE